MEQHSLSDFEAFFENNIDFLFILDNEGNIIKINEVVRQVLGYSDEDLLGQSVLMVHPPEFREEAGQKVAGMLSGDESFCPIPLLGKTGEYFPVETRVFPVTWNSDDVLMGVSRNLTELKLSEEKFANVFNLASSLMAISTMDTGVFIDVNRKFLETLGFTREEVIGKTSRDLNIFPDHESRRKAMEMFQKQGRLDDLEIIISARNGDLFNCLFSVDRIRIQTHEYILTSAANVTRLKETERRLRFLFDQQTLLSDVTRILNTVGNPEEVMDEILGLLGEHTGVSRVYVFEDSTDGRTTSNTYEWCNVGVNSQKDELQDFPYEEIPSWKLLLEQEGRIFSKDIKNLPEDIYRVLAPQEIKSILVYPLLERDSMLGFLGFDECERRHDWQVEEVDLLKIVSSVISSAYQRRRVLGRLRDSELRLKMAIEGAGEGLWDWNNRTGQVYFNDVWCEMLGYQPEEIEPSLNSWEKLVHPQDMKFVREELTRHLKGESEIYETIHRLRTKDGSWKWILAHGMVVERDEAGTAIRTVGTHINVTSQKQTEKELESLIRNRDKLFSIISHDLRGPISSATSIIEMITEDDGKGEAERNRLLRLLSEAFRNAQSLIENVLNWAGSQMNRLSFNPVYFDILAMIDENIAMAGFEAAKKSIDIVFEKREATIIYADRDSVDLVLRNLFSNAVKFTPEGGRISIDVKDRIDGIEVLVSDSGVGMTPETIESIFKDGICYSTKGTANEKGTGLGLILCKDFIERNNGSLSVTSRPGQGTTFTFSLPKDKMSILRNYTQNAFNRG